jgi:hypothetical protein
METQAIAHFVFIPVAFENCSDMANNTEKADKFYYWTIFDKRVEIGNQ